ncbi:MAG: HAMP domain-containing histidine kinase [Cellvibrionaceae bacterium]|nr:HAMP domain-containing histidine kinase [Cellvibrionaceae bacterium]
MTTSVFQSLFGKLASALTLIFVGAGLLFAALLIVCSRTYEKEVSQQMHLELAQHVVDNYLLFNDGKPDLKAAKKTFHNLMILGPNFEFYLLDSSGNILSYSADPSKIKREKVSTRAFPKWKQIANSRGYVLGDDPRSTHQEKIFSLAPIEHNNTTIGYLYVVIGSQIQESIAGKVWASKILKLGLMVFGIALLFIVLALLFIVFWITRPLSLLTRQVKQIKQNGFDQPEEKKLQIMQSLNHWQADNKNDIHVLGYTFKMALERLEQQYQNVVSIDDLRKELLSHVSHDLRTPLASLLGYLETWELQKENLTKEQSGEYISIAKRNAHKISTLIEQLFELAHLDGDNVQVNQETFSIAELVQDVLQKFAIQASKKNIELSVTPHDSSIRVRGDVEKMERVFTNLVENALRHTLANGSIVVKVEPSTGFVSVHVSDTGIGIPENDLPFIFDAHYKAGNSVRENTAHGGLGLAITKKLLALHESAIQVKSQVDSGTTFSFTLPSA